MPKPDNIDFLMDMTDTIDDAVRSNDDLSYRCIVELMNNPPHFREPTEQPDFGNEKTSETDRILWRIKRDVTDNIQEVTPG